jgi:hypothetical protein
MEETVSAHGNEPIRRRSHLLDRDIVDSLGALDDPVALGSQGAHAMSDKDRVKYEADVEKLVATFAVAVNDAIEEMKKKLVALADDLGNKVYKLPLPAKGSPDEINKAVNDIVAAETKSFKGFLDVALKVQFDEKTRKLGGHEIRTSGTSLRL